MTYEKSIAAFTEAKKVMPGGVNSPVRAFKSVNMDPIFMASGKGATITDIDGNTYIDYVLSWGPLILGHAHPDVVAAIQKTAESGTSFGAPTLLETELAELVINRVPSIEMVRMVNSGTDMRVGYTGACVSDPVEQQRYDAFAHSPVFSDTATIEFKQTIPTGEPLRTGVYSKQLTFTLSTTQP